MIQEQYFSDESDGEQKLVNEKGINKQAEIAPERKEEVST